MLKKHNKSISRIQCHQHSFETMSPKNNNLRRSKVNRCFFLCFFSEENLICKGKKPSHFNFPWSSINTYEIPTQEEKMYEMKVLQVFLFVIWEITLAVLFSHNTNILWLASIIDF